MKGIRLWWIGGLFGLGGLLMATTWNNTYEAIPNGAIELASDLDTFIKSLKAETRQRLEVEHEFGGSTEDNGLHTLGSARTFVSTAAPTDINSGTAARGQYNSAAASDGGTALTTTELNGTSDIGTGRLWIDTDGADDVAGTLDDFSLYGWNEIDDQFEPVVAALTVNGQSPLSTLVYNGSFEVTDGTGSTASTTVPAGWTVVGVTPTFAYPASGTTEGAGRALRTTAVGSSNQGVRQALAGLKASTNYTYRVRVKANSGDHCTLNVDDGFTAAGTTTTVDAVYQTLEVNHTTDSTPDTVNLELRSTANGDVCEWDHVTVQERLPVVAEPNHVVCFDTDNTATDDAYTTSGSWVDALVSCAVTIPGPGYVVNITGQLVADNEAGSNSALAARIRENSTTTVGMATAYAGQDATGANLFRDLVTIPLFSVRTGLTPGTTYTYTLEATPDDAGGNPSWDRNIGDDAVSPGADANLVTSLRVELIPPN